MYNYQQQLEKAVRAISIDSPTTYSWFGRPSLRLPRKLRSALTSQEARNYLLYDLASRLYSDFYLRSDPTPSGPEENFQQAGLTPFVTELSVANSGAGYWEKGWRVRAIQDDVVEVCRGNLLFSARRQDCDAPQGTPILPEVGVRLRFPKEFLGMSPGFYMALGNKPLGTDPMRPVVRLYWNLTAEGAGALLKVVTRPLNQSSIPFRLKVLNDPALFTRCDAAVLYILKSDYDAVAGVLNTVYTMMGRHLKPGTPALTKQLAPGIGLAEDPGRGQSFGQHRCRAVADAAIRAYEKGKKSVTERMEVVAERFAEEGISIALPFLNAGSTDDYPSPFCGISPNKVRKTYAVSGPSAFLHIADELGCRICKEAVWHGDLCNWIGAEDMPGGSYNDGHLYRALGPTLYSGTSGVALFLSELHAVSPSRSFRRTALGAMEQALAHVPVGHWGLYTGTMGIALAAVRVGCLLGEQELLNRASGLVDNLQKADTPEDFDLLSGASGAIIGVLLLRKMLNQEPLIEVAIKLGNYLLQSADSSPAGYSWVSPRLRYLHNLTGLSHGTSGVAYSLLELFHVTGDARYGLAAEQAFQYERSWFDSEQGNWPDFRDYSKRVRQRDLPWHCATFWCHGAPGIGMVRLRACEILNDATSREEAIVALETTEAMIEAALHAGNQNFSLCHGLTGNAEALLYGRDVLGDGDWISKPGLAVEVANAGIERANKQEGAWHCGVEKGETPGLLLGLAGIGYFYLRLHNPAIPSVLLPRPTDFPI